MKSAFTGILIALAFVAGVYLTAPEAKPETVEPFTKAQLIK